MKPKKLLAIRKTEKDPFVRDRIMLNVLIIRNKMSISEAARPGDSAHIILTGCSIPLHV